MSALPAWMLILQMWILSATHPYYVSVTEIEYDQKAGTMGVSCKFFTDDLEEALKGVSHEKVDLSKGDRKAHQKRIEAYLQAHFQVTCGKAAASLRFIGTEHGPDATWCYLEATGLPSASSLQVLSDCFYEIRKEQVHIFHITVGGERKSRKMVNPEKRFSLSF
ncbi:MAG: hypothetical protein FJX89_10200 [Bacteroidetes bacterium]|nr:hypothetical protein [Bacteroidota bacterium]